MQSHCKNKYDLIPFHKTALRCWNGLMWTPGGRNIYDGGTEIIWGCQRLKDLNSQRETQDYFSCALRGKRRANASPHLHPQNISVNLWGTREKVSRGTSFVCFITRSQPLSMGDRLAESGPGDERAGTRHIYQRLAPSTRPTLYSRTHTHLGRILVISTTI